jgi:WD40 repeat protein
MALPVHIKFISASLIMSAGSASALVSAPVEIVSQTPHTGISVVAFSPDATLVLSGGDETLKIWDVATGNLIRTFDVNSGHVHSAAYSPDGRYIASGSDTALKLWDVASGSLTRTFEGGFDAVASIAFFRDGSRILAGDHSGRLRLWDVATGTVSRTFKDGNSLVCCGGFIDSVALSPDETRIVSASLDGELTLWDVASGTVLRRLPTHSRIRSVAFSPNGATLVSGGRDIRPEPLDEITLRLWNVNSGTLLHAIEADSLREVTSVAYSPDGSYVLSAGNDGIVKLWNAANGSFVRSFEAPWAINAIAFSRDGTRVVAASIFDKLRLWNAATGEVIQYFGGRAVAVRSVALSKDGAHILTAGDDQFLRLWDATAGTLITAYKGGAGVLTSVAFSPDGRHFLLPVWPNELAIRDTLSGSLLRSLAGPSDPVDAMSFSPDGTRVLAGSGGWIRTSDSGRTSNTLLLWDVATGKAVQSFGGYSTGVTAVAFSGDGAYVLSAASNYDLTLWDAKSGGFIRRFQPRLGCDAVAFSPSGSQILCGKFELTLWDTATGDLISSFGKISYTGSHSCRILAEWSGNIGWSRTRPRDVGCCDGTSDSRFPEAFG